MKSKQFYIYEPEALPQLRKKLNNKKCTHVAVQWFIIILWLNEFVLSFVSIRANDFCQKLFIFLQRCPFLSEAFDVTKPCIAKLQNQKGKGGC